jgi:hypothetical protein
MDQHGKSKDLCNNLEPYFNGDSTTPSNTPSAKQANEVNLKSVNFDNFLNIQNNYDSYASNNLGIDLAFCETSYIGNAKGNFGLSVGVSKNICSNLICAKCDTKVSPIVNQKWNDNCDYTFFKNNHGDEIKLSEVRT